MGIDDSAFVIGLVGRLHPMKDHETFFRAVEIAARSAEDLMAVCVGGGDDRYRKSLEKAITDLGIERICKLVGEQRDVHQLYAAFDVVCLTSACGEGFPNVIGEAMASGIPCVVTHVGECERSWVTRGTSRRSGSRPPLPVQFFSSVRLEVTQGRNSEYQRGRGLLVTTVFAELRSGTLSFTEK